MLRAHGSRMFACAVALLSGIAAAGCGSSASSTTATSHKAASRAPKLDSTPGITGYWRAQVAAKYNGPVARGHGRGCAQASKKRWVCTAHIQNPNKDIDVYGTVTLQDRVPIVTLHLNHGNQITAWFAKTRGGCQTNSCAGARFAAGA